MTFPSSPPPLLYQSQLNTSLLYNGVSHSPDLHVEKVDQPASEPQGGDVDVVVLVFIRAQEGTEGVEGGVGTVEDRGGHGHLLDHDEVAERDLRIASENTGQEQKIMHA